MADSLFINEFLNIVPIYSTPEVEPELSIAIISCLVVFIFIFTFNPIKYKEP